MTDSKPCKNGNTNTGLPADSTRPQLYFHLPNAEQFLHWYLSTAAGFVLHLSRYLVHCQILSCYIAHLEECLFSSSSCPGHFHSQLGFPTPVHHSCCWTAKICCCWQDQRTDGLSLKDKSTFRSSCYGLWCFGITVIKEMPSPRYSWYPSGPVRYKTRTVKMVWTIETSFTCFCAKESSHLLPLL